MIDEVITVFVIMIESYSAFCIIVNANQCNWKAIWDSVNEIHTKKACQDAALNTIAQKWGQQWGPHWEHSVWIYNCLDTVCQVVMKIAFFSKVKHYVNWAIYQ